MRRHGEFPRAVLVACDAAAALLAALTGYGARFLTGFLEVEGELLVGRYVERKDEVIKIRRADGKVLDCYLPAVGSDRRTKVPYSQHILD